MNAGGPVVLDACVLANYSLCDTLLRLAEPPRLYDPRWSEEIFRETIRTLVGKLDWPPSLARHFESELRAHFTEAWVTGFEPLIAQMTNDPKDRHVAAAAVHCGASAILTFNLRDFSDTALAPWGVRPIHPQIFLTDLLQREPDLVKSKLQQQAADRNRTLRQLLQVLAATIPEFASAVLATIRR